MSSLVFQHLSTRVDNNPMLQYPDSRKSFLEARLSLEKVQRHSWL